VDPDVTTSDHNEKHTKFGKPKRSDNKETFGLRVRQRHPVSTLGWVGGRAAFIGRARVRRSIPATSAKLDENAEKMPNMIASAKPKSRAHDKADRGGLFLRGVSCRLS